MAKILNRFTNNLICEEVLESIKEIAVKNKADLMGANLWGANLRGANLWGSNLSEADLMGADLRGADLRGANLWGADLMGAKINDRKIVSYKDISGIGNSKRQLRCFMLDDNSFYFMTECFSGIEKELKKKVLEKYGLDCEYIESIKFLKKLCKKYKL